MSEALQITIGAIIIVVAICGLWLLGQRQIYRRQMEQMRKIRDLMERHGGGLV